MSLILIIVFILIGMSSSEEPEEVEEHIAVNRICKENKDYVDASVMFRNTFWVIIDEMYYEFTWDIDPFVYKAEGLQEIALKEYDATWAIRSDDKVKTGRFLGGFYHNIEPLENYELGDDDYDKLMSYNIDMHPNWLLGSKTYEEALEKLKADDKPNDPNIYTASKYFALTAKRQVIVFKDEHNSKDKYHIKYRGTESGLQEFENTSYKSFNNVPPRGSLESLLTPKVALPPRRQSLPMVYDYLSLKLYVIINQKDSKDVPRLYYNSFKYKDFAKNWKYVDIPKGYRYNAFIPLNMGQHSYWGRETTYYFSYRVIAEPFRDVKTDKKRGPSFLFELQIDKTGIPSLKKLKESGMSLFECKFISASSTILYIVFGVIITILLAILVIMVCFVSVNYFFAKERIVIVRQRHTEKSLHKGSSNQRAISLDRSRLRRGTNKDEISLDDKRSASVSSDQNPSKSDKKIKI